MNDLINASMEHNPLVPPSKYIVDGIASFTSKENRYLISKYHIGETITTDELEDYLAKLESLYYNGEAIKSDRVYDELVNRAIELNPNYSKPVGASVMGEKIRHQSKMLSMDNVYNSKQLRNWLNSHKVVTYIAEPKLDGLSLELVYINGELTSASTRGDGVIGECVLRHMESIDNVPMNINAAGKIVILGEVVMSYKVFDSLPLYSDPRNAASGLLRSKNRIRDGLLKFFPWDFSKNDSYGISYSTDMLECESLGIELFGTYERFVNDTSSIEEFYNFVMDNVNKSDYPMDGLVIKIDSRELQRKFGTTSRVPKYMIAYKFKAVTYTTKLLNIEWNVSSNGAQIPVAILEPVKIGGAVISKATLHNWDHMSKLHLRIGGYVEIIRSGDVIPKIISGIIDPNIQPIMTPPKNCSSCREELTRDLICINPECKGMLISKLTSFVSRPKMNIGGLGPTAIKALYDIGIKTPYELMTINRDKLGILGDKTADKVISNIKKAKQKGMNKFICSLGIPNVGNTVNAKIGNSDIMTITEEKLIVLGIGPKAAKALCNYIANNTEELNKLKGVLDG